MSSTLIACPPIGSHCLQRSDASRILVIDSFLVKFTPTQYRLLMPLLSGNVVSDEDLLREALLGSGDIAADGYNLDRHISKMRSRLQPSGLTIYRVTQYGYILLADSA